MRNLLHTTPSESELATILAEAAGRPYLPPLDDPAWSSSRAHPAIASWSVPLLKLAHSEATEPLPVLTDELYADFHQTGTRYNFERPFFERRRRLGRAALGMLMGDDASRAALLPSFLDKLAAILDEESWTLPASAWTEPTGKNPWMIDLFAAETAHTLAELLAVFRSVIPADLAQRIKTRLRTQYFENYLNPRASFVWFNNTNNWNAVCHQGVLGAAFAIEDDHALVARMLAKAARHLPRFLEGFGTDGTTSEGPAYWSYGFGWFAELNAQLEHRTAGRLSLVEGAPKVAAIARFALLVTFDGGHFVNFSDSNRTGYLNPAVLTYLGQRFDDPVLSAQGAAIYRHHAATGYDLSVLRADFFTLSRLVLRVPSRDVVERAVEPARPDVYFPDYGAIVVRGSDARGHFWEFAAKAGHNAEHHNHNDCGGFILNLDRSPAFVEIGAPEYNRVFFNPETRYQHIAARSLGHSVPFVNGHEQHAGREFAASVLKADIASNRVEFVVDLTRCYPPEARCNKLVRTWLLDRSAGRLTVSDAYELDGSGVIETILITADPVAREGADVVIATRTSTVHVSPSPDTTLTIVETCLYSGHHGAEERVFRLRFAPASTAASGTLSYQIRLA